MAEKGRSMGKFKVQGLEEEQVEVEAEEEEEEQVEAEEEEEEQVEAEEETEEEEEDGLVVALDTEDDEAKHAPGWVKGVRKQNRELQRELRETKQKLNEFTTKPIVEPTLGPKPTLEAYDYDAAKYEVALVTWVDTKKVVDAIAIQRDTEVKTQQQAWQAKLANYAKAKTKLAIADFDDAEAAAMSALSVVQQGIIVSGAKDPALVIYALGKNASKAKELAAIKDPVEFAFTVARMEDKMKVTGKRPATVPESRIVGDGRSSTAVNSTLERLRTEAAKTGDYTKVNTYKAKLKGKSKR